MKNTARDATTSRAIPIRAAEPRPTVCAISIRLRPFAGDFFLRLGDRPFAQVTVRDSGIGIDPEDQVMVFDKFYEAGPITDHFSSHTRFGGRGVGLGLALVKGMVESHGGMVWLESAGTRVGGSAFHVLLPLLTSEAESGDDGR